MATLLLAQTSSSNRGYASEDLQADPELQRVAEKAAARRARQWAVILWVANIGQRLQRIRLLFSRS